MTGQRVGRVVISQYGGRCATCNRQVEKGEYVYWRKGEPGVRSTEIYCMDDECAIDAAADDGVAL